MGKTITIEVLLFASLAQLLGESRMQLTLPDNATVGDALDAIALRYPKIQASRARLATAVNLSYTQPTHRLSDGDELALIPPVSGG